jgi:hypothetical protein
MSEILLTTPVVMACSSHINDMIKVLRTYKDGKVIEDKDQYILEDLAMTGYIRYGYEFDQTTFLVSRTAKTTAIGDEIVANS